VRIKGGEGLDKALEAMESGLLRAGTVRAGFLEGATYPDGGLPVAAVAAIQNFGAPNAGIPPRPFFSNMVKEKGPGWADALARILVSNEFDAEKALALMGEGVSGQLRQSIIETLAPPLSQITLMLRKMRSEDQGLVVTGATVGEAARRLDAGESPGGVSTKPLVDTGHLLNSVGYEVE